MTQGILNFEKGLYRKPRFASGPATSLLSLPSYKPIVEFIDAQFEAYLQEELKIRRVLHSYHDSRIHACLYFIAPTGHSLKSLDLVTMKKLDSKVRRQGRGRAGGGMHRDHAYWSRGPRRCQTPGDALWPPHPLLHSLSLRKDGVIDPAPASYTL